MLSSMKVEHCHQHREQNIRGLMKEGSGENAKIFAEELKVEMEKNGRADGGREKL